MLTVLEKVSETNLMASVEANSNAEAGIMLRFHDPENYLVALYSPSFKAIYVHDRKNGALRAISSGRSPCRNRAKVPPHGGGLRVSTRPWC